MRKKNENQSLNAQPSGRKDRRKNRQHKEQAGVVVAERNALGEEEIAEEEEGPVAGIVNEYVEETVLETIAEAVEEDVSVAEERNEAEDIALMEEPERPVEEALTEAITEHVATADDETAPLSDDAVAAALEETQSDLAFSVEEDASIQVMAGDGETEYTPEYEVTGEAEEDTSEEISDNEEEKGEHFEIREDGAIVLSRREMNRIRRARASSRAAAARNRKARRQYSIFDEDEAGYMSAEIEEEKEMSPASKIVMGLCMIVALLLMIGIGWRFASRTIDANRNMAQEAQGDHEQQRAQQEQQQ